MFVAGKMLWGSRGYLCLEMGKGRVGLHQVGLGLGMVRCIGVEVSHELHMRLDHGGRYVCICGIELYSTIHALLSISLLPKGDQMMLWRSLMS